MRMLLKLVCLLAFGATSASADQIVRVTPDGSLGNIAFRNLAMNGAGDYVAVSVSNVFTGNASSNDFQNVYSGDRDSFVTTYDESFNISTNDSNPECSSYLQISLEVELHQVRSAINASGDYVLATRTKLFVGNTRSGEFRNVHEASQNTEFQSVAINDAGHYVAASYRNVFGGQVSDGPAISLITETNGNLGLVDAYDNFRTVAVDVRGPRLTINANGRFVALASQSIYAGSVPDARAARLATEGNIGFQHVVLNDNGQFVATSQRNIFRGSID